MFQGIWIGVIKIKLLIAGSRSVQTFNLSEHIPPSVTTIISGGAQGVDKLAEEYADQKRLSKIILRPNYALYGRAAPIKRNEEMVALADCVLIIWDGKSKGTKYTAEYAKKQNKQTTIILCSKNNSDQIGDEHHLKEHKH